MAKSHINTQIIFEEEEDYAEMEGLDDPDVDSDGTEEDPTYIHDIDAVQSKLSHLSIKTKPNPRDYAKIEIDDDDDDDEVLDVEEMNAPKLGIKDLKSLEEVERIIDCGQVEKLKVEQCKVYLRKHGLRLTGKKDTFIQRIKEHLEIVNGGGEKKFPPSSFVLNCKGDACLGDIVMFEQTVYEGYSIVSRSVTGPPCGKRTVAGRIVNESYGAAKQQHTFTVEVLWSKGDKPLPPLHPLLIKGRNLYKLNTLRQRWGDEYERQRVLNEKHSRGSLARSNREARIQERLKKNPNGIRRLSKDQQHSRQEKNCNHGSIHDPKHLGTTKSQNQHTGTTKAKKQKTNQLEENLPVSEEFKENSYPGLPVFQPTQQNKSILSASILNRETTSLAYEDRNSSISSFAPPKPQGLHYSRPIESTLRSHYGHPRNSNWEYQGNPVHHPANFQHSFQEEISTSTCNFLNQRPRSYHTENGSLITSDPYLAFSDKPWNHRHESLSVNQLIGSNRPSSQNYNGRNYQRQQQQPCRYYPQGKCTYGDQCRFLHESNSRC